VSSIEAKQQRFLARLQAIVPQQRYADVLNAHRSKPDLVHLLALPWRISLQEAQRALQQSGIAASIRWQCPPLLAASPRQQALMHPLIEKGALFALSASSAAVALALEVQPSIRLLDACAAPGGKLLAAASIVGDPAAIEIVAVERVPARFYKLRAVLARAGISAQLKLGDARRIVPRLGPFDRVLVDAPCSTEARLRFDDPASWRYWSERKIAEQRRKQLGLLRAAARALAADGTLVYATCSYAPEENESVVEAILQREPSLAPHRWDPPSDLDRMPALDRWQKQRFQRAPQASVRILATKTEEAMFVARMKKERAGGASAR